MLTSVVNKFLVWPQLMVQPAGLNPLRIKRALKLCKVLWITLLNSSNPPQAVFPSFSRVITSKCLVILGIKTLKTRFYCLNTTFRILHFQTSF